MQHCPARAAQRLAAAVLALCLVLALAVPHAHAAALQETHGIRMLDFSTSQILSIGNQTSGKCSWYALRYARTILDGKVSSGSSMWSNGAVWSAGFLRRQGQNDFVTLAKEHSGYLRFFSSVAGGDGGVNCANQRSRPRSFCFTSSTDPQALSYSMSVMSPAL